MKRFFTVIACCLAIAILQIPQFVFAENIPEINAPGAIVMDYDTGEVLYAKNPDNRRSAASMTKVMTAYITLDLVRSGQLSWDTLIPISQNAKTKSTWNKTPFREQERLGEMFTAYLVESNNQIGIAIAEFIGEGSEARFAEMMNEKARHLGIDAYYTEANGLKPNKVSPRAQALLTQSIIREYPEILKITSLPQTTFNGKKVISTNKFYRDFYYFSGINGFKTGTASYSGQCLTATCNRDGRKIISVVMGAKGKDQRYHDTMKIIDYSLKQYPSEFKTSSWAVHIPERASIEGINTAEIRGLNSFRGQEPMNRGEFALLMALTLRLPIDERVDEAVFKDVDVNAYYASGIAAIKGVGLIDGYEDGTFRPEKRISREEMAKIFHLALGYGNDGKALTFADTKEIHPVFRNAVASLVVNGVLHGRSNNRFDPKGEASREEASQMMLNLIDRRNEGK